MKKYETIKPETATRFVHIFRSGFVWELNCYQRQLHRAVGSSLSHFQGDYMRKLA